MLPDGKEHGGTTRYPLSSHTYAILNMIAQKLLEAVMLLSKTSNSLSWIDCLMVSDPLGRIKPLDLSDLQRTS